MNTVSLLQFGNAAVCTLLAVHLWLARGGSRTATQSLAGNYTLFAIQSALLVAHWQLPGVVPGLLRPTLALLLGPALLFYFSRVMGRPFRRTEYLHAMPAGAVLLLFLAGNHWLRFLDPLILGSFSVYFIWGLWCLRAGPVAFEDQGAHALPAYRWLSILVLLMALNLLLEIGITVEISNGIRLQDSRALHIAATLFLSINAATVLAMLRRSSWLQWMFEYKEVLLARYQSPKLTDEDARRLFRQWESLVTDTALYKVEFGITLAQAARKLGVPARDLSYAINSTSSEGFSQYLNRRRVNEAIALLERAEELPITEVMHAAGFSSKSHFNKEFLRVTGMAPSQYRMQHK
jgi:AraC-like DNA-binding protein